MQAQSSVRFSIHLSSLLMDVLAGAIGPKTTLRLKSNLMLSNFPRTIAYLDRL